MADGPAEPTWAQLLDDPLDEVSAAEHWAEITDALSAAQTLAMVNGHAIKRLVLARVIYDRSVRAVLEQGAVVPSPKTKVPQYNLHQNVMAQMATLAAQLESELALSPRKRASGGKVATPRAAPGGGHVRVVGL